MGFTQTHRKRSCHKKMKYQKCRFWGEGGTKKEMVPSDLSNNSASFRHARSKLCNLGDRAPLPLCSPRRTFARLGSTLQSAPVVSRQIGTCSSERPFALLKRLPASGPPFQSQCSWPIPSVRHPVFPEPVRPDRSSTHLVSPRRREFIATDPLPGSF